jgi:omega-6 fatty acid desaturase (delta-12 desaturase)
MSPSILQIKEEKRAIVGRHAQSDDFKGLIQALTTLTFLTLFWWVALLGIQISYWLTVVAVTAISLFTLRAFALMHECGHGSLFRSRRLNRAFGFGLGVVAGMPQYVWSQHHNYHHATNGNWDRYRGLYTTLSVNEYAALTPRQQQLYRGKCNIAVAPLAGLIYAIFNPRFNWLKGSGSFLYHLVKSKIACPGLSLKAHGASFETRYWKSAKEYWHMFWNNVVLLSIWGVMCWEFGVVSFFTIYLISASLAGTVGIILFTVQHNFDHSYASASRDWDLDTAAIEGTSFLILPRWLNYFTANIAYHHVHHLSARIPNYQLTKCHFENRHLFREVTRLNLLQIPQASSRCILWDAAARRIISVAEYQQRPQEVSCSTGMSV